MTEIKSVPQALRDAAGIYEERNKLYGDNYKRHGAVMDVLFPHGIELQDKSDHNRFGVFTQMIAKVTRYAEQFTQGGHPDSLDDLTVYTQMLQELDSEERSALAEAVAGMYPEQPTPEVYAFPGHALIPNTPLVFDDSDIALTTKGGNMQPVAEPPAPAPELPIEDPVKAAPPTVL